MLCHVVLCNIILFKNMLCHVMSCHGKLYYFSKCKLYFMVRFVWFCCVVWWALCCGAVRCGTVWCCVVFRGLALCDVEK